MDYAKIIRYIVEQLTEEERQNPVNMIEYAIVHAADFVDMTVVDSYYTQKETAEKTARLATLEAEIAKLKVDLGL